MGPHSLLGIPLGTRGPQLGPRASREKKLGPPGLHGPLGRWALRPMGSGPHGLRGPRALGAHVASGGSFFFLGGHRAPGVCPTKYGGPCIWRDIKVNETLHMMVNPIQR